VADDRPFDIVRDAIAELGLPLVRLEQRRQSLEDLFRDDVPAPPASAGAPMSTAAPGATVPPAAVPPAAATGGGEAR
jgi:ABC-2 type transport system ATP-binding protein